MYNAEMLYNKINCRCEFGVELCSVNNGKDGNIMSGTTLGLK